ncbi:MAG: threonylcarbamoyl-AMP synthase [Pelagibacterales bacterium MED-G43]|nr:MAG: threonylcarbamoyl-AMP synthase [Pelagibacterales bacterium MED-G43]|tara:strand:+ start:962 stop:1918 length:957 start_codon:yes stop_codon:yes gene_type:complete
MKNSYSNIFSFNKQILKKSIINLSNGDVIGLPTETVYGLGGNAYSKKSIQKIYKLKGRPKSNPLIVHYFNLEDASQDVIINDRFKKLYKRFCPGPITFILTKKNGSKINSLASAKLNTIAIRFPKHRAIRSILKKIDFPLAMPSANKSNNVSPVTAEDVFDEFNKEIKLIIDGGKCKIGIESTVVDLVSVPKILRPGIIEKSSIEKILKKKIKKNIRNKKIISPGMMKKHYSPGIPVLINQKKHDGISAFIYLGNNHKNKKKFFSLSKKLDLTEAASNLYRLFRLIKKKGYKKIQIGKIPNLGSGIAINDRIQRASKS